MSVVCAGGEGFCASAAKAAMAAYTMSIQLELPDSDVRIVDLQPAVGEPAAELPDVDAVRTAR